MATKRQGKRKRCDGQTKRLTIVRAMPKQNPGGIRAQVRRLPSGQIQIKVPLKRGENPAVVASQLRRALGSRVKSIQQVMPRRPAPRKRKRARR